MAETIRSTNFPLQTAHFNGGLLKAKTPVNVISPASRSKRVALLNAIRSETSSSSRAIMPAINSTAAAAATNAIITATTSKKVTSTTFRHPPYLQMIENAVQACDQGKGVSKVAIHNFIKEHYQVGETRMHVHVRNGIKQALNEGILREATGKFPSGSFKIARRNVKKNNLQSAAVGAPAGLATSTMLAVTMPNDTRQQASSAPSVQNCAANVSGGSALHSNIIGANQAQSGALQDRIERLHSQLVTVHMVPRTVRTFDRVHNNFQNPCFNVVCRKSSTLRSIFGSLCKRFRVDDSQDSQHHSRADAATAAAEPEIVLYDPPSMPGDEPALGGGNTRISTTAADATAAEVSTTLNGARNIISNNRSRRRLVVQQQQSKERRCWNSKEHRSTIIGDLLPKSFDNTLYLSYDWKPPEITDAQQAFLFGGMEMALPNAAFQQHLEDLVLDLASLACFTSNSRQQVENIRKKIDRAPITTTTTRTTSCVAETDAAADAAHDETPMNNINNNDADDIHHSSPPVDAVIISRASTDSDEHVSQLPPLKRTNEKNTKPKRRPTKKPVTVNKTTTTHRRARKESSTLSHETSSDADADEVTSDPDAVDDDDDDDETAYASPSSPQTMEAASLLCTFRDSLLSPPSPAKVRPEFSSTKRSKKRKSSVPPAVAADIFVDVDDVEDVALPATSSTTTPPAPYSVSVDKPQPIASTASSRVKAIAVSSSTSGETVDNNASVNNNNHNKRRRPTRKRPPKKVPPEKKRLSAVAAGSAALHSILRNLPLDQLQVVPLASSRANDDDDSNAENSDGYAEDAVKQQQPKKKGALLKLPNDFDSTRFCQLVTDLRESGAYDELQSGDRQLLELIMSAVAPQASSSSSSTSTSTSSNNSSTSAEPPVRVSINRKRRKLTADTNGASIDQDDNDNNVVRKRPRIKLPSILPKSAAVRPRPSATATAPAAAAAVPTVQILKYKANTFQQLSSKSSSLSRKIASPSTVPITIRTDLAVSSSSLTGKVAISRLHQKVIASNNNDVRRYSRPTFDSIANKMRQANRPPATTTVDGNSDAVNNNSNNANSKVSNGRTAAGAVAPARKRKPAAAAAADAKVRNRQRRVITKSKHPEQTRKNFEAPAAENMPISNSAAATADDNTVSYANVFFSTDDNTSPGADAQTASTEQRHQQQQQQQQSAVVPMLTMPSPFTTFVMQQQQQQNEPAHHHQNQSIIISPAATAAGSSASALLQDAVAARGGCDNEDLPQYTTLSALLPPPIDHSTLFGLSSSGAFGGGGGCGGDASLTSSSLLNMPPISALYLSSSVHQSSSTVLQERNGHCQQNFSHARESSGEIVLESGTVSISKPSSVPRQSGKSSNSNNQHSINEQQTPQRRTNVASTPATAEIWAPAAMATPLNGGGRKQQQQHQSDSGGGGRRLSAAKNKQLQQQQQQQQQNIAGPSPPVGRTQPINYKKRAMSRFLSSATTTTATAAFHQPAVSSANNNNDAEMNVCADTSNANIVPTASSIEQQELFGTSGSTSFTNNPTAAEHQQRQQNDDAVNTNNNNVYNNSSSIMNQFFIRNSSFALDDLSNNITINSLNFSGLMDEFDTRTNLGPPMPKPQTPPPLPQRALVGVDGHVYENSPVPSASSTPRKSALIDRRKQATPSRALLQHLHVSFAPTPAALSTNNNNKDAVVVVDAAPAAGRPSLNRKPATTSVPFGFGAGESSMTPSTPLFVGARPMRTLSPIETSDNAVFTASPLAALTTKKVDTSGARATNDLNSCRRTLFTRKRSSSVDPLPTTANASMNSTAAFKNVVPYISSTSSDNLRDAVMMFGQNSLSDFLNADTQSLVDNVAAELMGQHVAER